MKWDIKLNQIDKRDITIDLCNEVGSAVVQWKVSNAFPTTLDVPTFQANGEDVAIESMTLMADGVTFKKAT